MIIKAATRLLALGLAVVAQTSGEPVHLATARGLVRDLGQGALVNEYGSNPTFLRWGMPTREARTVCGSFLTRLMERSYGLSAGDVRRWLGANGSDAVDWWRAIDREDRFRRLRRIDEIRPGDVVAVKYDDGSKDTGHVMVADEAPRRIAPSTPLVTGTEQYVLAVIDSSASGHGPGDTRHRPGGGFSGGIGRGEIRLYANRQGRIEGYAWSETPKSTFYKAPARTMVVGRLLFRSMANAAATGRPLELSLGTLLTGRTRSLGRAGEGRGGVRRSKGSTAGLRAGFMFRPMRGESSAGRPLPPP